MTERRLAAILVADVVGYSRLASADEAGTLAHLATLRREIVEPALRDHHGRLFKAVGDGLLVEFASAVQAVEAARAIQQANAGGPLPLRIGIHVGDVVVQGDDLMGDGVNIAARIEGVADPGGVAISRAVHEQVRDRIDAAFEDKGEVELKNITRPVQVFVLAGSPAAVVEPALALPDKPSIAVLPFQNMSGDPEQEYFVDGLVEDIITALSRFKSLFVIARNSSFTYKGRAVDIKQVGRELGVRYVLEGSVRKAAGQLRITGQLIEAASGAHLWADRFDGSLEDVFALQDQVTASVVGAIAPKIDKAEMERAARKPVENLDAYDCFLRGLAHSHMLTRESLEEALRLFYRAIELDPDFATPYGLAARCYSVRVNQGWIVDRDREAAEVRRLAARVAAVGRDDALALCHASHALDRVCRDHEAAEDLIDQAIALNPNLAACWRQRAFVSLFAGEHEAAIEHAGRALRLNPLDPQIAGTELLMASALLLLGRHDEALAWAKRAHRHSPNAVMNLRALAAANAFAGDLEEARRIGQRILELDPTLTLSRARTFSAFRRPEDLSKWIEGIRLRGIARMTEQRRLAAILVADVVGYSRLATADESGTVAKLGALRRELIDPAVAKHAGRLFKAVGDGFLVEFASAVQAVACAVAIQRAGPTLPLRIGIHLGDVIVQGDDLLGDGVNIAARIEGIADPGGIAISRQVHDQVRDRLDFAFDDKGKVELKNLARPVHVFAVAGSTAAAPVPALALPDKPSIAVLPFQNMSGDPEQEYFADGISEDVITALSRSRDFLVTARNSTFTYKGTSPDIRQVGRDLGVRYVLEGSVRKSGDRLRITAQLIDATSGNHVWAERYDRPTADVFAVQDEITESVVASIEPQLLLAEGGRHKRSPPADLDAWGYVARAFTHRVMVSAPEARVALGFIERALEIDPNYARALAEFAFVTCVIVYNGWRTDREQGFEAATAAARKAIALDPEDPFAHAALGLIYRFTRRYDEALPELLKAVDLNPNFAFAHAQLGISLAYAGRPEEGLEHTARALRISPRDPQKFFLFQAHAIVLFVAARYAEAIEAAQLARQQRAEYPNPLRMLAASFALSGDIARAQAAVRELKRLQPDSSLAQVESNIDASDETRGRMLEGLRLAGLQ